MAQPRNKCNYCSKSLTPCLRPCVGARCAYHNAKGPGWAPCVDCLGPYRVGGAKHDRCKSCAHPIAVREHASHVRLLRDARRMIARAPLRYVHGQGGAGCTAAAVKLVARAPGPVRAAPAAPPPPPPAAAPAARPAPVLAFTEAELEAVLLGEA